MLHTPDIICKQEGLIIELSSNPETPCFCCPPLPLTTKLQPAESVSRSGGILNPKQLFPQRKTNCMKTEPALRDTLFV